MNDYTAADAALLAERLERIAQRLPWGSVERQAIEDGSRVIRLIPETFDAERKVMANLRKETNPDMSDWANGGDAALRSVETMIYIRCHGAMERIRKLEPKPAPLELAPEVTP